MEGFDDFYSRRFDERWEQLKSALRKPAPKVFIKWRRLVYQDQLLKALQSQPLSWYPRAYSFEKSLVDFAAVGNETYLLDAASVLPVMALDVADGQQILDMCAAPGGKTLLIADQMADSQLMANDLSLARVRRLHRNIKSLCPPEVLVGIQVTQKNAATLCRQNMEFDRILVDAPCSSERHLLNRPTELAKWSSKRSKRLVLRQWSLLSSAFLMLSPGGRLVYSTCSICADENDGVTARLFKKYANQARIVDWPSPLGEKTSYGWEVFPDSHDWGPIYFSVIEKAYHQ